MKNLFLILVIFVLSTPAFAVPGYDPNKDYGGVDYDISDSTAYKQQLEANFDKKYIVSRKTYIDEDGVECDEASYSYPEGAYDREVMSPYL